MGQYTKNGLLNGYKKNNKEREELDYYATPTAEVLNILNIVKPDLANHYILEPCIGGGHMMDGIIQYLDEQGYWAKLTGTDIKDRGYVNDNCKLVYGLDFLDDDYLFDKADTIIMNPPYATLEPFLIRALEIADKNLIVLCRTQALEGASRWQNIFKENPPTDVYQYIDRIQCWKNGEEPTGSSAQAYCWFIWDKQKIYNNAKDGLPTSTELHWMHRA